MIVGRLVKRLAVLILSLGLAGFAAQSQSAEPQISYDEELLYWLRAEQINQRCGSLNYFESRLIDHAISDILIKSSIQEEAGYAVGRGEYSNIVEAQIALLALQRSLASLDVVTDPCSGPHPDVNFVRSVYVRQILYMLAIIRDADEISRREPIRTQIVQQLFGFASQLYGEQGETVWNQLMAEADAGGYDPEATWEKLHPVLTDTLWDLALGRKGYKFALKDAAKKTYQAVRADGSGAFPVTFHTARDWEMPVDNQQAVAAISSYGLDEDGRLVFAVVVEDPAEAPSELRAQMLVQDEPGFQAWGELDWRAGTLKFDGELMADDACPAMYCFRFDQTLSEALRFRRNAGSPLDYRYEIYIATPENFPADDSSISAFRKRYYADDFLIKD